MQYKVIATGNSNCRLPNSEDSNFIYATMDFTDPYAVHDVFDKFEPGVVVHAAAMSKPDECEQQQWQAYLLNAGGTVTTLMNGAGQKRFFIFLSTEFIFDGQKGMYKEDDETGPVNYYGHTKIRAEEAVKEDEYDRAIVRTVMVYGKAVLSRSNILTVIKEKLAKGEVYNVLDDQWRTST